MYGKITELIWQNRKEIFEFCVSVGVAIAALYKGYKWSISVIKPAKLWVRKMNDAARCIEEIKINILPNGGKSLNDAIGRVEKKVDIIADKQSANIELSSDCFFQNDATGNCIAANDALCTLFGTKKERMMGDGWKDFVLFDKGESEHFEERINSNATEITGTYTIKKGMVKAQYIAQISRDINGKVQNIIGKVIIDS